MQDNKSIPVPTALKELILSNNQLLSNYQQELTNKVIKANLEIMELLHINPTDGWKLDIENMVYVKQDKNNTE
jgi:hypothetical protein